MGDALESGGNRVATEPTSNHLVLPDLLAPDFAA